ncbi:MAG: TetR/AcrR family transcriptional regulator [Alphaproteobacteria bacterium]|nr:TetR/AcrR family transcriptional regulator [Alphaproteobacteria bacterium]
MVQVKKKHIQQALLDSAYELFSERGYHQTTLQDIADRAGTGVSSLYSYFPSKLHLLYGVIEPWHRDAFLRLEKRVKGLRTPRAKLRAILLGVWRDMPMENVELANSLMAALASADPAQQKPRPLLRWVEDKLNDMLAEIMREAGRDIDYAVLPNLIMMAYDGYVMNRRLNDLRDIDRLADAMCDMMLGEC